MLYRWQSGYMVFILVGFLLAGCSGSSSQISPLPRGFHNYVAESEGVHIHYIMGGHGAPLVLLHGFPETWYEWRKVLTPLAQHYRIIAFDLPGLGDSSAPKSEDTATIAAVLHQVVQSLHVGSIYLVAHDWGGPVGYAYAAAYRSDVSRLVEMESFVPGFVPDGVLTYSASNASWLFPFQSVPTLPEELMQGHERTYLTWLYQHYAFQQDAISQQDIDVYASTYTLQGLHNGFGYYRAYFTDAQQNAIAAQAQLAMPVLAIGGDHSFGVVTQQSLQMVASNVQGVIIKNCGHFVPEEQPATLIATLESFLPTT